jgi:hypothetical protein
MKSVESLEILKVDPLTTFGTPVEIVKLFGGKALLPRRHPRTRNPALQGSCLDPCPTFPTSSKTIQDIMRKDAGTYGDAQRLEQLGWMFFLKIFDDREKETRTLRDRTTSRRCRKHLRWSNWATDEEGITGEALLDFVNNTLLPKLKSLTGGADKIAGSSAWRSRMPTTT